jgi:hypothetical protein
MKGKIAIDIILDFEIGKDKIQLDEMGFDSNNASFG